MSGEVSQKAREALAVRDEAYSVCPFLRRNSPPSKLACDVCNAESSEPCRKRVIADAEFVDAIRAALIDVGLGGGKD